MANRPRFIILSSICSASLSLSLGYTAETPASLIDYSPAAMLSGENPSHRFNLQFSYDRLNFACHARQSLMTEPSKPSGGSLVLEEWRPWQGRFRLSAGVVYLRQYRGYTCPEFGAWASMEGEVDDQSRRVLENIMPYMGLGWDASWLSSDRLDFNVEAGVLYGAGDDAVSGYRPWRFAPAESSTLRQLDELELSPVFSLGVSYTF